MKYPTHNIMRSVNRDAAVMRRGLPAIDAEIASIQSRRKTDKSAKKRLERLLAARKHLIESPKESASLVDQLKEINHNG